MKKIISILLFVSISLAQNYSLSFDGENDNVSGIASTDLDVSTTNRLTISSWVKPINSFTVNGDNGQNLFVHTSGGAQQHIV